MTTSHTRTYIETDDLAIMSLSCHAYKVLRYLANRSNELGRCFPKIATIHANIGAAGSDHRHVHRALLELEQGGWIGYLRRNQNDPVTKCKLPNVYVLNPQYICLTDDARAEAAQVWAQVSGKSLFIIYGDSGVTIESTPITSSIESDTRNQVPETNNNNHQTPEEGVNTAATPAAQRAEKAEKPRRAAHPARQQSAAPLPLPPSSAPPPSPARLPNPPAIAHQLPDAAHEALAARIRLFGVPMPLARGFVCEYSVLLVEQAYTQTVAAVNAGTISNPGGFFRTVLQGNLVDPGIEALPRAASPDYAAGRYADIVET